MPIIRKKLEPGSVYPTNIRYNEGTDTVQSLVNGEWVDNPLADPRNQTTLPPRLTADPDCDAAQSVVDALKAQIDATITAIDNGSTAFTIAGLILGLFSFGVFAVFISIALTIADAMIGAGASALTAALTEPVYEQLVCIIKCHMTDEGRLDENGLEAIISDVNGEIGGLAAVTINAMLTLAGEGGVNNLASIGTSTGDCSECDCGECLANWHVGNFGGFEAAGTFVGIFDGYMRFESTLLSSNTQAIIIMTDSISECCELIDYETFGVVINPGAQYHVVCGDPWDIPHLGNTWPLNGCYTYLSVQLATGTGGDPFTVDFLFGGC